MALFDFLNIGGKLIDSWNKSADAKQEIKLSTMKAKADADALSYKQRMSGWVDEAIIICVMCPVLFAFIPGFQPYIERGFDVIEEMPIWYQSLFATCVAVGLGLKGGQGFIKFRQNNPKKDESTEQSVEKSESKPKPKARKQQGNDK